MEKRQFSRAPFDAHGVLVRGEMRADMSIENVSLKGARVLLQSQPTPAFREGESVTLEIHLSHSTVTIRAEATVIRIEETESSGIRVGLRFITIDLDSMIHLRRLLEFNGDGAEDIATELGRLTGESSSRIPD